MQPILRTTFLIFGIVGLYFSLSAQINSRSGFPARAESKTAFKRVPCDGDAFFSETFDGSNTLPTGFQTLDEDGEVPRDEILFLTPQGGWQIIADYKDSTNGNLSVASPSWYQNDSIPSDDWLILPQVSNLPANTCFSFLAYSQDSLFAESYEVRISTSGTTPADFLANDPILVVDSQPADLSYQAVDLAAYEGQDVSLAIRHTSLDRFILVVDDFRMTSVKRTDLAVFSIDTTSLDLPGDTFLIRGSIVNRGLDTLSFDSAEAVVGYRYNNSPYYRDRIDTAFTLLPNETFEFEHVRPFVAPGFGLFYIEAIINVIPGDEQLSNDTLIVKIPVGTVLSVDTQEEVPWTLSPNPADDHLFIQWPKALTQAGEVSVLDLQGRQIGASRTVNLGASAVSIPVNRLAPGLYLLQFTPQSGRPYYSRFRKQ